MGFSLLMFLQNIYSVTTTTSLDVLKSITLNSKFDLIILDTEPSAEIEAYLKEVKAKFQTPFVLTYVYKDKFKQFENEIRKYVNSIFYKPYDLNEVSSTLSTLVA